MRDQTSYAYHCPRCGTRGSKDYRDQLGGMWLHLACPACGCKFDVKTTMAKRAITSDERDRRAVAALSDRQRAHLTRLFKDVDVSLLRDGE